MKVCLVMFVRNESLLLEKCLKKALPWIDAWLVVAAGADEATLRIIKESLQSVAGELHKRRWINQEFHRNEALILARHCGDYLLLLDPDEELQAGPRPSLEKGCYFCALKTEEGESQKPLLIRADLEWKCDQEGLSSASSVSCAVLKEILVIKGQSSSVDDAQSHNRDPERALEAYRKRAGMGGNQLEVYHALFQIARLEQQLQKNPETFIDSYLAAFHARPTRREPLYYLADYFLKEKIYLMSYLLAKYMLGIPKSDDRLYTEDWIYEYGALYQFAESAYHCKKTAETREAFEKLLQVPSLPQELRSSIEKNLQLS